MLNNYGDNRHFSRVPVLVFIGSEICTSLYFMYILTFVIG
jgi:hypothetical protein